MSEVSKTIEELLLAGYKVTIEADKQNIFIPKNFAEVIVDLLAYTANEELKSCNECDKKELIEYLDQEYPEMLITGEWWSE